MQYPSILIKINERYTRLRTKIFIAINYRLSASSITIASPETAPATPALILSFLQKRLIKHKTPLKAAFKTATNKANFKVSRL
jgi:hypothetical protein